jgi:putative hydrolase of the HAD superfamily
MVMPARCACGRARGDALHLRKGGSSRGNVMDRVALPEHEAPRFASIGTDRARPRALAVGRSRELTACEPTAKAGWTSRPFAADNRGVSRLAAVLFDIDDTLYSTTEFAALARRNAVRAMIDAGLDLSEDVLLKELDEVLAEFSSNYEHHFDKLLQRLRPSSLTRVNPALIVAAGVGAYHDTKFRELEPFDDVIPLLADMKAAGLRVGIITHGWTVKQAEKLVRLKLVPYLDPKAIFISDQIGISKPNPKLYLAALRDLALEPSQAMYVGDSPEHDIAPPHSIGMITVWATRAAKRTLAGTSIVPDHTIANFGELRRILRERYGVPITADERPTRTERANPAQRA